MAFNITDTISAISAAAGRTTAGSGVRGSGTNAGGKASKNGNPYDLMYRDNYGYIFGKPLAFHPRTDPNQRVYQKTMLRNNTIVNIIPGIPYQDSEMLAKAKEIIKQYEKDLEKVMGRPASESRTKQVNALVSKVQDKLIKDKCDLRYAVFKQDIAGFTSAYQLMLNRVGTALFGTNGGVSRFVTEQIAAFYVNEDASTRGFKVWVEKGTSISETVDNSFTRSIFEETVKTGSNLAKQLKFIGMGAGLSSGSMTGSEIVSENKEAAEQGTLSNIVSRTVSGANYEFPQVFDESKFNRSYEISFRFVSPYGDDRSIANYVIFPFLFLLTCSSPRQEGPSGHLSPFLLQVDAPGFFSCPMGVVTSFSFRKGGDEMLFNDRGLPLIIEGSLSVQDLYTNMSLPLDYGQFVTNFGTSAFLNTLGGLNLYATMDSALLDDVMNTVKGILGAPAHAYAAASELKLKLQRFFGATG